MQNIHLKIKMLKLFCRVHFYLYDVNCYDAKYDARYSFIFSSMYINKGLRIYPAYGKYSHSGYLYVFFYGTNSVY